MAKIIRLIFVSCLFIVLTNLFACQHDSEPDSQNPDNSILGTWDSGTWNQSVWQ